MLTLKKNLNERFVKSSIGTDPMKFFCQISYRILMMPSSSSMPNISEEPDNTSML
jgi:hypothetical protein